MKCSDSCNVKFTSKKSKNDKNNTSELIKNLKFINQNTKKFFF